MEPNHIYQFSLLNALMDGVSETGITVSKLRSKGNQGLGTFARMNGELDVSAFWKLIEVSKLIYSTVVSIVVVLRCVHLIDVTRLHVC